MKSRGGEKDWNGTERAIGCPLVSTMFMERLNLKNTCEIGWFGYVR